MKEKKGNLYFLWVSNSKGSCLFGGSSMFPPEEDRAGEVGGHLFLFSSKEEKGGVAGRDTN